MFDAWVGPIVESGPGGRDCMFIHLFSRYQERVPWNSVDMSWSSALPCSPHLWGLHPDPRISPAISLINWETGWPHAEGRRWVTRPFCGPFKGELDWKDTMVQCQTSGCFLAWPHNPTGLTTLLLLYVMKSIYLLTYSEEAQNQGHQAHKGPAV